MYFQTDLDRIATTRWVILLIINIIITTNIYNNILLLIDCSNIGWSSSKIPSVMLTNCSTFSGYKKSNSLKIDSLNYHLLVNLFGFMVFNAISDANHYLIWEIWLFWVVYEHVMRNFMDVWNLEASNLLCFRRYWPYLVCTTFFKLVFDFLSNLLKNVKIKVFSPFLSFSRISGMLGI